MSTTAQCYYKAAREEVITRLRLRDQLLLAYIVASSSIIGLSISNIQGMNNLVTLMIPFLATGVSILTSAHSIAIIHLGTYTVRLKEAIDSCRTHNQIELEPWDYSSTFMAYSEKNSSARISGYIYVICIPAIFSLVISGQEITYPLDINTLIWVVALLLTIYSFYKLLEAHNIRKKEVENRMSDYKFKQMEQEYKNKSLQKDT